MAMGGCAPCDEGDDCVADLPLSLFQDGEEVTDTLWLRRGTQGLQHVEVDGVAPFDESSASVDRALCSMSLSESASDEELLRVDVGLAIRWEADALAFSGLRLVVPDPDLVLGQKLSLVATVAPVGAERNARESRMIWVKWDESL
jgi:hypothetical protein